MAEEEDLHFLSVVSEAEARQRLQDAVRPAALGEEEVELQDLLGRVLSHDVISGIDVPGFARSNLDGFALRSEDVFGADEVHAVRLRLSDEVLHCGVQPQQEIAAGCATKIATGGMLPRGADAVVMVEDTRKGQAGEVLVQRAVAPGQGLSHAGDDIARGETVLFRRTLVSSRETAVLAALGMVRVWVHRQPQVAILSTGGELREPGENLPTGGVYDSNGYMLAAAVCEQGCQAVRLGIFPDDEAQLDAALQQALACDVVLLSGGTSKGEGDLNHRAAARLKPGIFVHGVSLKPGKPLCLAMAGRKLVAVLPGFPTSAAFTFHLLIAPVLRQLAGMSVPQVAAPQVAASQPEHDTPAAQSSVPSSVQSSTQPPPAQSLSTTQRHTTLSASLPVRMKSERGRTEFALVSLTQGPQGLNAWPLAKGSGSVAAFSRAEGFIVVEQQQQWLDAGSQVAVHLLGKGLEIADLVVIGSHCIGLDRLLAYFSAQGWRVKSIPVGSEAGLLAAQRGECDLAGCHLWHEASQSYNAPFITPSLHLFKAYQRQQALVFRSDDARFKHKNLDQALQTALSDPSLVMVNRNHGSGTRALIDSLLKKYAHPRPRGFFHQAKSHHAVTAAILQHRADWGITIPHQQHASQLQSIPIVYEDFDFLIPQDRLHKPAVQAFLQSLQHSQHELTKLNMKPQFSPITQTK